ncbi:hypothetical protein AAF712_016286 [Marasmius tenuissimus]|uniref:Uncharacterized protein n=1 Tax=Marasmius tenuissimus TaxID=585030 RepID=A0ABR2Z8A7_9AGAR
MKESSSRQAGNSRYNPLSFRPRVSRSQPAINDYDPSPFDPTPEEMAEYMKELRVLLRQYPGVIWDFNPIGKQWIQWNPSSKNKGTNDLISVTIPWNGKKEVVDKPYQDPEEEDELDVDGTRELNAPSPPHYSPPPFPDSDNTSSAFSTPQKASPTGRSVVTTLSTCLPSRENPGMSTILFGPSVQDSSDILNKEQVKFREAADPDFAALVSEKTTAEILVMEELPARLQDFKAVHSGSFFLRHCSDVHTSVGGTILDLAGTPGVAPGEFNSMISTSKTCPGCSSEFSSWGFRFHLGLEGECRNSKSDFPVSFIVDNTKAIDAHVHDTKAIDAHVHDRLLNSRHILPGSLQEKDAVTELVGSLFLMWNSPAGIPSDLWEFAKEGKVFCNDCFHYRTVEGHALHIDAKGSCIVAPALRDAGGKGKGKAD